AGGADEGWHGGRIDRGGGVFQQRRLGRAVAMTQHRCAAQMRWVCASLDPTYPSGVRASGWLDGRAKPDHDERGPRKRSRRLQHIAHRSARMRRSSAALVQFTRPHQTDAAASPDWPNPANYRQRAAFLTLERRCFLFSPYLGPAFVATHLFPRIAGLPQRSDWPPVPAGARY